jgi:hypothetical protein
MATAAIVIALALAGPPLVCAAADSVTISGWLSDLGLCHGARQEQNLHSEQSRLRTGMHPQGRVDGADCGTGKSCVLDR